MSEEREKAAFLREAEEMYDELRKWRAEHAEASFDEIANQVTPRRRALMGSCWASWRRSTEMGAMRRPNV